MLNDLLQMLEQRGVFAWMGPQAARQLVIDMVHLSQRVYDCNQGEILDGMGSRLGICERCLTATSDLVKGLCAKCRDEQDRLIKRNTV
jgi:hypothetical protein